MAMEMSSKTNTAANNHLALSNCHHIRNLWPSVGGGLPGGKPIEPALGSSAQILQKSTDYFSQSTSYAQNKPVPRKIDEVIVSNINNNSYYHESSQARPYPMVASNFMASPEDLSHFYTPQSPKYFQHSAEDATVNRWYPPPPPPQTQTPRFYHPDPTILFNQVSLFSSLPCRIDQLVVVLFFMRLILFSGDVPVPASKVGFIRTDTVLPFSCCA